MGVYIIAAFDKINREVTLNIVALQFFSDYIKY